MNRLAKLKEIATVITGHPFKGELYSDSGIRTVRGENVTEGALRWDTVKCWNQKFEKENYYMLRPNDVVIGMDGSKVGKNKARIKKEDLPLLLAQRVACVRTNDDNDQRFLFYLINNPRFELYVSKTQTGSSVPHISKEQIENFEVPKLDLTQQRQIADILSALDDKIELNNRINAELEQMAKTLYDYWFVQFDFSNEEGKPYKASGGKMVYDKVLKSEVPEGWVVKKLGKSCKTSLGGTPSTANQEYWNGDIPWLNSGEVADFPIINSIEKITQQGIDNSPAKLLPRGTILISITRHLRANVLGIDACVNQSVVGIHQNDKLKTSFIYLTIKNQIPRLMTLRTGAQQPHINKQIVDESNIIVPSDSVLHNYYLIADPIFDKIVLIAKENQELAALRDWLLPMLMNGQVTVQKTHSSTEAELPKFEMAAETVVEYERS